MAMAEYAWTSFNSNAKLFECAPQGEKVVSIYPRVSGSISDKDVLADPERYEGKTKAEEAMLTPDMLQWSLGATIQAALF